MKVQTTLQTHFMPAARSAANLRPQHGEAPNLQEQFTGPLPLRHERPIEEILAERLAESDPDSAPPVFIP